MTTPKQMRIAYKNVFGTPEGQLVLRDLERIANQSRIQQDNPNPYACVYKIAQQGLIRRIENMIQNESPDVPNNKLV
jgi:hypothetical protein